MSSVLERSYGRVVRVNAPLRPLYREMDAVDGLVRFIPQIESYDSSAIPGEVRALACVSIGPLSYQLSATVLVERVNPPHGLRLWLRAPDLRLELDGTFDFTASAANETTVRYEATIRSAHPLVRRMRSSLIGTLEEHVDSVTDQAVARGRRYTRAARVLAP